MLLAYLTKSALLAALLVTTARCQSPPGSQEILHLIKSTVSCNECRTLLLGLKTLARFGDGALVNALTAACVRDGVEDTDVCTGLIAQEGPILAHALREIDVPSHTADLLCTSLLGQCDLPEVRPYNVHFPKPKPLTSRPTPSGQKPIKFVHYSDVHVDLGYTTGSSYNCSKPICCRPFSAEDAPGNTSYPAGPHGNHNCDSPKSLETSMFEAIQQFAPDAAFALFTGDIPEHHVWLVNQTTVTRSIEDTYGEMASILTLPVYGTLGNHEAFPVNSYPFKGIETDITSQWVYDLVSTAWKKWIGAEANSVKDFGAYSYKVPDLNLRVISINTNLFYKFNFWMYEKDMQYDPDRQWKWLVDELQEAEDAGERVYILGHMPPGVNDALHDGSNYLDQIVNRYDATIAAMFWGHTHKEHFELSYSDHTNLSHLTASMVSYISPSLTPTSGSPAFRIITVDPVTFGVLDITTYAAPLEKPDYQAEGPTWEKYSSAKETYGSLLGVTSPSEELTPGFWHNITVAFENDDAAFQAFIARKSRGWQVSPCTEECKKSEICQLRAAEAQYNCLLPERRAYSIKQDREAAMAGGHIVDDCHSSGVAHILQSIASGGNHQDHKQEL